MKIAVSGKGGCGKTTIASALAIVFSKNHEVIAVDADPCINLHTSLGMESPIPISRLKNLIHDRSFIAPGVYNLNPYVDDILEKYSSKKGRIKLLTMGTIEKGGEGCTCPENAFLRAVLRHILRRDEFLILDTEAGIEHLGRKIAQDFDLMLVVVEPSAKAVETANRIHDLSMQIGIKNTYAIGNKIASEEQRDFIKKMLKFQVMDFIPFDEDLLRADMRGEPLTKCAPFFNAIERISKGITSMRKATSKYGTNLSD